MIQADFRNSPYNAVFGIDQEELRKLTNGELVEVFRSVT